MDLAGQRFGKWLVIRRARPSRAGVPRWRCRCQCGTEIAVAQPSLRSGASTGCLACRPMKHGLARTREYRLWMNAKMRAKREGLSFDLRPEDITVPAVCPLLGTPIAFSHKRFFATNPSLDRIIPQKGYVRDNVWVISWRANAIKNDASIEELEAIVQNLRAKLSSL
jgi:hypothetical protein